MKPIVTLMAMVLMVVLIVTVATPVISSIGLSGNLGSSISFLEDRGYWVLASGSSLDNHLIPSEDATYDIGSTGSSWRNAYFETIYFSPVSYALRPSLDLTRILGTGKPTKVTQGVAQGFSFPIYAPDEELYFDCHVPNQYDEASNIMVHAHGWIDTANTNKKFKFTLEWEHVSFTTDTVPNTTNNVSTEISTGTADQYQTFNIMFPIDYDIDGTDIITTDDCLYFRLRRVAASTNEISGEFVICHIGVVFQRDKL